GLDHGTYVATGLEHDESGHHVITADNHENMMRKRFAKFDLAQRELGPVARYGAARPEIGVIGWGSTEGPIREAVERAAAAGVPVAALHPRVLKPLPAAELEAFAASVRRVIVPEHNYTGQFAKYLRAELGIDSIPLHKYGGLPFTPSEIYTKILAVAGAGALR
ncbi:MAG: 2-oxoacid:acceptor oxidoreductase subunit alpha, partial [Chloroflexi bacterium]|nr:2-oxoacid:acceptor oxidoreductase subunit alpha [Chloroflexota bacterium]